MRVLSYRRLMVLGLSLLMSVGCGSDQQVIEESIRENKETQTLESVTEPIPSEEAGQDPVASDTTDGPEEATDSVEAPSDQGVGQGQAEADLIDVYIEGLSDEQLVGQMFFIDRLSYEASGIPAGGIIFFKPDLDTWEGVQERNAAFQGASDIPLFLGIDEEGGIVTRITGKDSIGGTPVGSAWKLAQSDDPKAVFDANRIIAEELGDLGFNMNFAPVADINSNPSNPIIGKRAFSDEPHETATYVLEALKAYQGTGITPVVKHFPGHGDTHGDSHDDLVYIDGNMEDLMALELMPFQAAIDDGVQVVMMGHIVMESLEDDRPASMNPDIIQTILREQMGFRGLIISDSMSMGAITKHMSPEEAIEEGLNAGLDLFLMPEDPLVAYEYLLEQVRSSDITRQRVVASVRRILSVKHRE